MSGPPRMTTPLEVLEAHGCFMSETDEAEIDELVFKIVGHGFVFAEPTVDAADLARRTCMCGERFSGFDDYHDHLIALFNGLNGEPMP